MLTLAIDPVLDTLIALGLWYELHRPPMVINVAAQAVLPPEHVMVPTIVIPAPMVNVTVEPAAAPEVKFLVPADVSRVAQDQHRATILHRLPDGTWFDVGHAEFENRLDPGVRITQELATEGRAIRWPDGTIQVN